VRGYRHTCIQGELEQSKRERSNMVASLDREETDAHTDRQRSGGGGVRGGGVSVGQSWGDSPLDVANFENSELDYSNVRDVMLERFELLRLAPVNASPILNPLALAHAPPQHSHADALAAAALPHSLTDALLQMQNGGEGGGRKKVSGNGSMSVSRQVVILNKSARSSNFAKDNKCRADVFLMFASRRERLLPCPSLLFSWW